MNEMKNARESTGNREMNGSSRMLCNEIGSDAGRGKRSTGMYRQLALQDVEQTGTPAFFRQPHPAHQPMRGEAG
ncbi:MAG: hypothetical protein ABSG49_06970 [Methanoregula sp.]|jgi:hypothetical protein